MFLAKSPGLRFLTSGTGSVIYTFRFAECEQLPGEGRQDETGDGWCCRPPPLFSGTSLSGHSHWRTSSQDSVHLHLKDQSQSDDGH